jgi:hypothetical protein
MGLKKLLIGADFTELIFQQTQPNIKDFLIEKHTAVLQEVCPPNSM